MSYVSPAPEVLQHLFLAKDALLGQTWLRTTRILLSADILHHLVLTSKIPPVVKARDVYGHFCTACQSDEQSSQQVLAA
jgi:hypothetical protein